MTGLVPESDCGAVGVDLKETELTLGLPGELKDKKERKTGSKRSFYESIYLNFKDSNENQLNSYDVSEQESSFCHKPPPAKEQVVGWPPVRATRKKALIMRKYVKVRVDGAPFLRKIDLLLYSDYSHLFQALHQLFSCFTIRNYFNEGKLILDPVNGNEYVPTYEDKDGDWMMVGDVPWKMFVESCKRLRLMKSSEAILAPRTPPNSD